MLTLGGTRSLPGSVVERQLHESFSRMLAMIPEELQKVHRTDDALATNANITTSAVAESCDIWDGWNDAQEPDGLTNECSDDGDDDIDLGAMGF